MTRIAYWMVRLGELCMAAAEWLDPLPESLTARAAPPMSRCPNCGAIGEMTAWIVRRRHDEPDNSQ